MAKRKTLREKIIGDPRVQELWRENDGCFVNDGFPLSWWATLKDGFNFEDCSSIHEPTLTRIWNQLQSVEKNDGT